MSRANVQIAKNTTAAVNRADFDAALESFAPDAELKDLANGPDQATVVTGIAALREVWALWLTAFDELRADVAEYIDAGDAVVCETHWVGRGKSSGISIDVHQFDVYEFHGGKIIRATLGHKSKDEAMKVGGRSG
jgi:ketosteroid isomerase-like protein